MKVAINGFGRIGRNFFRAVDKSGSDIEIVAVNDLTNAETLAYLLEHDSVHGHFGGEISVADGGLVVDGRHLAVLAERDPASLPWADLGVDVVLESTGIFTSHEAASQHRTAGAEWVIVSAPSGDADISIVIGANDGDLDPATHKIISNASCTTNCVVPMVKVLDESFGIEQSMFTTVHAYTNDQSILDLPHKDLRRARAAALNIIPTSTGAGSAVGKVMPSLAGKFEAKALRVPVPDGSITDVVAVLSRKVTVEEVNAAYREASEGSLSGILRYSTQPLVSTDIVGDPHSCILDSPFTTVSGSMVKVFGWYDNEWGYSNRLVDVVAKLG